MHVCMIYSLFSNRMSDMNELMHKGYAFALRGSGARATIADCDRMYVSEIDILVFSTGNFRITNLGRGKRMKDKPFDGIIGHYDNEIKMDGLDDLEETKVGNIMPQATDWLRKRGLVTGLTFSDHFKSDDDRNKYIGSANMLKKELRGKTLMITRSMDAEERFHQKRMECVKYCIHVKHYIPLDLISMNWALKHVSVKGQIVVKTCQSGSLKCIEY